MLRLSLPIIEEDVSSGTTERSNTLGDEEIRRIV
jgi:hypothetical protein